jgi:hypothetical protein
MRAADRVLRSHFRSHPGAQPDPVSPSGNENPAGAGLFEERAMGLEPTTLSLGS